MVAIILYFIIVSIALILLIVANVLLIVANRVVSLKASCVPLTHSHMAECVVQENLVTEILWGCMMIPRGLYVTSRGTIVTPSIQAY